MLTDEASARPRAVGALKRACKLTAGGSVLSILAICALLVLDGLAPGAVYVPLLQGFSVLALVLGAVALIVGAYAMLMAKPSLRAPFLFVLILTSAVFAAHMYVINSPAATTSASLQGAVGSTLSDGQVTVTSQGSGSNLTVSLQVTGTSPVGTVAFSFDGTALPQSRLSTLPTLADPLQPERGTYGTWILPVNASGQLSVSYEYLSCYDTSKQVYGCVMDESYYVPAAQGILNREQCAPYADNCNLEHPFLSKGFMAAGMAIFGMYSAFGWRIFNVIFGTLCIPLFFVLVMLLSRNRRLSYISSALLATDTMFFVHASIGVIDTPAVFFSLLAFVFYFWRTSFWKIDNRTVSGIFLGLALLAKETSIFMVLLLVCYDIYTNKGSFLRMTRDALKLLVPAALVSIFGLQVYASVFTSATVPTFVQEIDFILKYGSGLTGVSGMWRDWLGYITPLRWLLYYSPVGYLVTTVTTTVTSATGTTVTRYVGIGYYGVTNPVVTWLVFAWVPLVAYEIFSRRRAAKSVLAPEVTPPMPAAVEGDPAEAASGLDDTSQVDQDSRAGTFALLWLIFGYVPYVLLYFYGRVTYPFYIVPTIPALALGSSYFVSRRWFPSTITAIYVIAAFAWFFLYFPVKDFLPIWIRVLLGR